jgi:hypothetical protein
LCFLDFADLLFGFSNFFLHFSRFFSSFKNIRINGGLVNLKLGDVSDVSIARVSKPTNWDPHGPSL